MKLDFPKIEEKILKFWEENRIFEKTLERTRKGPRFVFYEGPPFANGLPGIHHLLSRAFKDIILRYKTMRGFYVERRAGWDTHGLPTEMEAEKKLNIKTKKEIEELGVEKFIEECRRNVFTYKKEWEDFTRRIGFWLDFENAYITCENNYIESLWWILKEIWEKGLLYQDYKVVPYCPRCGTSLSSHEVAQEYKTTKENSIYVKFKTAENEYLLVWTTTPWTLPGNTAIAINSDYKYVKVKINNENFILAEKRLAVLEENYEIVEEFKGKKLIGKKYQPLYPQPGENIYKVIKGDFVSLEEGTGLVHIAPAFGEDDMRVSKENNLPVFLTVDTEGKMRTPDYNWNGIFVKNADPMIVEDLKKRGLIFKEQIYEHEYPFCWRCKTPLIYYAKNSWFIRITSIRDKLIKNNKRINWFPEYIKEGRFGDWLKEIKDWNLSRERYWGVPLPVWQCENCKTQICVGSIEELKKKSGQEIKDLHRPFIDKITFKCEKCEGRMRRVLEVIDCWFDSGSMPFAQWHYPFENKEKIDKGEFFPADFISEGIDQTRGWFYTLLAVSTLLGKGISYKNVISLGLVLDAEGQKMSKSRGNIIVPEEVIDKFGADCVRLYFYTINPAGESKRFDFKDVESLFRKFFDTIRQSYFFFSLYKDNNFKPDEKFISKNISDRYIISRIENINKKITEKLDNYDVVPAARILRDFVDELSNWYIRRSRRRFQKPETKKEKEEASQTLYYVLLKFAKLTAPFTPFIAEELYQNLKGKGDSVHLDDYPETDKSKISLKLEEKMEGITNTASQVIAERMAKGIKIRQPLKTLKIKNEKLKSEKDLLDLLKQEVNIKEIVFDKKMEKEIELDTNITPELKEEGIAREVIRYVQDMRKKLGLKPEDEISVYYFGSQELNNILEKQKDFILSETKAKSFESKEKGKLSVDIEKEIKIDEQNLWLSIRKEP